MRFLRNHKGQRGRMKKVQIGDIVKDYKMRIIEQEKYYMIVANDKLLCLKPWKHFGTALINYEERKDRRYNTYTKKKGELIYKDLKIIEVDIIEPNKTRFVCPEKGTK